MHIYTDIYIHRYPYISLLEEHMRSEKALAERNASVIGPLDGASVFAQQENLIMERGEQSILL